MNILIVGTGFSGATCARLLAEKGHIVTIIDKSYHLGGACQDDVSDDGTCYIHKFGPHIFHTLDKEVWTFVNMFDEFSSYRHMYVAMIGADPYPFPINFNTLKKVYGKIVYTKEDADELIKNDIVPNDDPKNFEEAALASVGKKIYEMFIKGYTKKQWKMDPKQLPIDTFKRINIRYNFNDETFQGQYQGMPKHGYSELIKMMLYHPNIYLLKGIDFEAYMKTDFDSEKSRKPFDKIIYTGGFDGIPYRSIRFEMSKLKRSSDYSVMNYPWDFVDYTRMTNFNILHKIKEPKDGICHYCFEYPAKNNEFNELYPIETEENINKFKQCQKEFLKKYPNALFCGRLATYKYLDMDKAVRQAMDLIKDNF